MQVEPDTEISLRIDWADLDLFGHVNNVAFFRYIQAARVNFCESIGLTSLNDETKLSFMVASSQCQFKKPLLYPGEVRIHTRVTLVKNTSIQLSYLLYNIDGDLIAEGLDTIVVFDHRQKIKVTIPDAIRKVIEYQDHKPE